MLSQIDNIKRQIKDLQADYDAGWMTSEDYELELHHLCTALYNEEIWAEAERVGEILYQTVLRDRAA
jgi:hypothetical protein